jgi:hypothetical protein
MTLTYILKVHYTTSHIIKKKFNTKDFLFICPLLKYVLWTSILVYFYFCGPLVLWTFFLKSKVLFGILANLFCNYNWRSGEKINFVREKNLKRDLARARPS